MLNPQHLRTLVEVVRTGSFAEAARRLGYTPSAVSQQIQSLEREVGLALLERHARGVRLTDAGEVVVASAEKARRLMRAVDDELAEVAGLRRGSLRLGAFPTAGASLVPLAITTFRERHPGVELIVRSAKLAEMLRLLESREIEIGLLWDYDWCRIEGMVDAGVLAMRHILDDPMELVVARTHRFARRRRVRLAELADERWIIRADAHPGAEVLARSCRAAGFEPQVSFEAHDYQEAQGMVAVGLGVALIPRLALTTVRDDVTAISLGDTAPVRRILVARLAGRRHTPASEAMMAVFEQVAGQTPPAARPAQP